MTFHALLKRNLQWIAYTGNQWVFLQVVIECRGDLSGFAAGRNVFFFFFFLKARLIIKLLN